MPGPDVNDLPHACQKRVLNFWRLPVKPGRVADDLQAVVKQGDYPLQRGRFQHWLAPQGVPLRYNIDSTARGSPSGAMDVTGFRS